MSNLFRSLLLLAALLLGWQRPGSAQVFEWARLARNSNVSLTTNKTSATDAAGNTYVGFGLQGTVQAGSFTLTNPAPSNASALIKYDASGQVVWAKLLRGITVERLAVDPANGGVYVSGTVLSGSTWDGSPVATTGPYFYAKHDANGSLLWMNSLPNIINYRGAHASYGLRLAADGLGNCYLMGTLVAAGTVGGVAIDNLTTFLLQVGPTGTPQWVRQLHGSATSRNAVGPGGIQNAGLSAKPGGGCLVYGLIYSIIYYGPGTSVPSLTTVGLGRDGMVADYDATGALRWSRLVSGPTTTFGACYLNAAASDAAGNCYITGGSPVAMTFGAGNSTVRGFALAKYDATGTLQWMQTQQPNTGQPGWAEGVRLVVDPAGTALSVVVQDSSFAYGPQAVPTQLGTLRTAAINNVVRYNGQGQEQWLVSETLPAAMPPSTFTSVELGRDNAGNLYWTGNPQATFWNRTPSVPLSTLLGPHTLMGAGIALTRLEAQSNGLTGEVYRDLNGNGQRDAGEPAYTSPATAQVAQSGAVAFYPVRADGQLQAFATAGSYTLTLTAGALPRYHTITQPASGSYTGSFGGPNQAQSGLAFGIGTVANQPDVRISLTPYTPARAGFLARYRIVVENTGTTTAAGTVTATLDSRMSYVGSTPAATSSGNTLSWNYAGLDPLSTRTFEVQFSLPINAVAGTMLTHTAGVSLPGDLTPADNTVTEQQTVVGPYDPNDISVNYTQLTPAQLSARQPLDYTIRFQNMGTDTAFSVILKDTLDVARLQPGSLHMLAQSHNCSYELSRQGTLTVRLLGAKLPPRNTNVLGSQGFVRFRVLPVPTLPAGSIIPNRAHITFDYTAPVGTNTATTTVLLPTAVRSGQPVLSWDAYPNPVTDALTVTAALPAGTATTVELLDALGRLVQQQPLTASGRGLRHTLDMRALPAGLYLLRLRTPQGLTPGRTVIRQ